MVGAEDTAMRDSWPQLRQPHPVLRRSRISPGPLKSLERRSRRPVWGTSLGVIGLSLVATWAIASQIHSSPADAPHITAAPVAESLSDASQPARIVGAALSPHVTPAPELPVAVETPSPASPAVEASEEMPPAASLAAPPAPAPKPVAALPAELGALPVLELDETTFDAMQAPAPENRSRTVTRIPARP
ncbi:hypothetical protein [Methylorubrum extorquens]|uniref:hypothetical protein n=1 Tax=Methylorubrum extorquens TaxID=408 RepID=UPI000158FA64|nr:hypothetical protein [Methylorubrum extorquens]ABY33196.1 hypothetical protein Mext_4828 [Methylorubrum extorquens PA1]KQP86411.1 hypothetical protein ASF55_14565 [Methylobacterium sp. Leaf119]WIU39770.1 hypothetical protein KQ926_24930 [Methylorubrum extorquens]